MTVLDDVYTRIQEHVKTCCACKPYGNDSCTGLRYLKDKRDSILSHLDDLKEQAGYGPDEWV
jgi:hypothetical protein